MKPPIVCLCGSTRFYDAYQKANYDFTMQGCIVLSVGFFPHSQTKAHGQEVVCTDEQKKALDQLHLRKIDLADMVHVLNVGGYIGISTSKEIEYAEALDKPVSYLEPCMLLVVTAPPEDHLWRAKTAAVNELKPNEYDDLCDKPGITNEEFVAGVDEILLRAGVRVIMGEKVPNG